MDGFFATTKDDRVAGLETKTGGVGGDVRAALVDDEDDSDWHGDLFEFESAGRCFVEDAAGRIRQFGDSRSPWAMPSMRWSVSSKRSIMALESPISLAVSRSLALALDRSADFIRRLPSR